MLRAIAFILLLCVATPSVANEDQTGFITTDDGVRLFYRVVGSGDPTLVAVHGGPGNSHMSIEPDFRPLAQLYTVIYYDQRGNGRSDLIADGSRLSLNHHVADLEAVRRHFGIERMNLYGNSWGGLLVAAYASAHPERVERLIVHSAAPPTNELIAQMSASLTARAERRYAPADLRRFARWFDPAAHAAAENPLEMCREWQRMLIPIMMQNPDMYSRFRGDLCFGGDEAIRQQQIVNQHVWNTMGEFDLRPAAHAVTATTLVIHGVGDNIPLAASEAWTAAIPNARLLVIEGAGHVAQVERPDVFFPAIERFIAGDWPDGVRELR
jgi:proline iminopeptidase